MEWISDRITINDEICNGKPTIRGLRITVQTILEYLSLGDSFDEILEHYPILERKDLEACLSFAGKITGNEITVQPLKRA